MLIIEARVRKLKFENTCSLDFFFLVLPSAEVSFRLLDGDLHQNICIDLRIALLNHKMRSHSWTRLLKRKPLVGIVLAFVIFSAVVTVFRLSSSPRIEVAKYLSSSQTRSTSAVELSWPVPLSQSKESSAVSAPLKRAPVDDEQIKKLRMIYPL